MQFPLSLSEVSLWMAGMAILLLVTSELLTSYSEYIGDFLIDKKRFRLVSLFLGAAFMVTVVLRALEM